jgi:hypothetical protein
MENRTFSKRVVRRAQTVSAKSESFGAAQDGHAGAGPGDRLWSRLFFTRALLLQLRHLLFEFPQLLPYLGLNLITTPYRGTNTISTQ